MNILIVANHWAVCSARYAAAAFERLGHTVRHVGPAKGRDIWGLSLPERYVWEPDTETVSITKFIEFEGNEATKWDADLTIVMDSDPAILDYPKPPGGKSELDPEPVIVWGVDNHVRDYRRPYFDHYFLAHRNVSVMAWEYDLSDGAGEGAILPDTITIVQGDMTHIPCSYDPTLHTPSPIPFEEREYDVCMIGYMYDQRWAAVRALREAGFKVLAGCGLVGESYVAAYQNARISLCLSSNGDVAQRVFETARMGCVVMSDNCPDFQLLKPNGIWLLEKDTPEYIVQGAKQILATPDVAKRSIEASMAWAEPYSWDNAAQKVVGWYEQRN